MADAAAATLPRTSRPVIPTQSHMGATRAGPRSISRRTFVERVATTLGAAALGCRGGEPASILVPPSPLPEAAGSGIEHVVLVMMENRSFDHLLGWVPGADGRQAGLAYPDRSGALVPTRRLVDARGETDFRGCGHPDPDHSYTGGRSEYAGGACDGWLRTGSNDIYAVSYYIGADLAFLGQAARLWTVCDRYHCAVLGPTQPNRLHQHAAQTDRLSNTSALTALPTIWDRLAAAGRTGRYYYAGSSFLQRWGARYDAISAPFSAFQRACATDALPQVAFVDPDLGLNSDHPHQDLRDGEAFLAAVYAAVTTSPAWGSTVLVINFDEWGGFYDHVPPPLAPIGAADEAARNDGRLGFRVPCLVISPFARRGHVSNTLFSHASVLRMIEWRWGLAPLSARDASAANLAEVLDLSRRDLTAPRITAPPGPFGPPC